jgi:poly(A) polymerase
VRLDELAISRLRDLVRQKPVAELLAALDSEGEESRVVGGAVRNALLGIEISDIDIATTRLAKDVMGLAERQGWRAIPTGIEHGTVTVLIASRSFEVTTLREDIATDGRHAVVQFGRSFEVDAARRDFTVNAMSVGRDGVLHDCFGGMRDLEAQRVRFIGNADQRLREDYLRGLRFFRFSAQHAASPLDEAGLAAVVRQREGFAQLSAERIRQEMLKLLVAPRAAEVLAEAEAHGLISQLLTLPVDLARFASAISPDSMTRLYALGVRSEENIQALRDTLRLGNAESGRLQALWRGEQLIKEGVSLRHLAFRVPEALAGLAALYPRMFGATTMRIETTLTGLADDPPRFQPSGADLIARGMAPGPMIGKVLADAERRWISEGLPAARVDQDRLLEAAILHVKGEGDLPQPS